MAHRLRKLLRLHRNRTQRFRLHLVAYAEYDLQKLIEELTQMYQGCLVENTQRGYRSIDIMIKPSQLRDLQAKLPYNVLIAYEESPEKC